MIDVYGWVIVAQEMSADGVPSWIDLVTTIGLSGIFLFLYWDERKERRSTQQQITQLTERLVPALTEATTTLEKVQEAMSQEVRGAVGQVDSAQLQARIDNLLDELRRRR